MALKVIWKYSLGPQEGHVLSMPAGAQVIHADVQGGEFCLWAIVDPVREKEERHFIIVGTGDPGRELIAENHITTFLDGRYVWHVFEEKE